MNNSNPSIRFSRAHLTLSLQSRWALLLVRWLLQPLLAFFIRGNPRRVARAQITIAGHLPNNGDVEDCEYHFWGQGERIVPGHALGDPFAPTQQTVLLWLHGGAFFLPAMPDGHLKFVRRLCDSLSASALVPDYRLAPAHPYPAGLDDCEAAYRLLLDSGVPPSSIALGGESAGGNLVVALLYRIRRKGLPMPGCAVAVSPALDLSRQHGFASRSRNARREAMLPVASITTALQWYLAGADATHPEVSPLYGDCSGLPPTLIFASEAEILRDDGIAFAHRLSAAGVSAELALWPHLPHAFPLLEDWFAEAREAREQIETFIGEQVYQEMALSSNG